jgi:hypothetical protein
MTEMLSRAEVERLQVQKAISVNETRAESKLAVTEQQGQRQAEEIIARARSAADAARIAVDQETKTAVFRSEQDMRAAKDLADALAAEAEAEARAAESLRVRREHDLRLAKLEVLQAIAEQSKLVVGGETGERLIAALLDPRVLGDISLAAR